MLPILVDHRRATARPLTGRKPRASALTRAAARPPELQDHLIPQSTPEQLPRQPSGPTLRTASRSLDHPQSSRGQDSHPSSAATPTSTQGLGSTAEARGLGVGAWGGVMRRVAGRAGTQLRSDRYDDHLQLMSTALSAGARVIPTVEHAGRNRHAEPPGLADALILGEGLAMPALRKSNR
jgi:hypothetical protein